VAELPKTPPPPPPAPRSNVPAYVTLGLAGAGVWFLARDTIEIRVAKTREQFTELRARGHLGDRRELYRATWQMARDKPLFGWGMASYPSAFVLYNNQKSPLDRLPVFYHDAHSDWLQALAEHGFVGAALLALCALVPLRSLRHRHISHPVTIYLLAGCALLLLYAGVEFPFGNIAVVLAWWTCFFTAIHYARLSEEQAPPRAPYPAA